MTEDKDVSRFILEDPEDVEIWHPGRTWLLQPEGKNRRCPANKLDTLMSLEEFIKVSDLISS